MRDYFYKLTTDEINGPLAAVIKATLLLLSWLYGWAVCVILFLYRMKIFRKAKLSKPVISVGNITWGGVGKTPFIEFLAEFLMTQKLKPAILSRGYGKERSSISFYNDEVALLKESLPGVPIGVGHDRATIGEGIIAKYPVDTVLLDDAFQHWHLSRNVDIVLIDTTDPFGNGHLIPRGILREPLSALARADIFVLTKADLGKDNVAEITARLKKINPRCPILETIHKPTGLFEVGQRGGMKDLSFLRGKSVCAVSAIGDPKSFELILERLGAELKKHFIFEDHYRYKQLDIEAINSWCRQKNIEVLVATQKDAVKLAAFPNALSRGLLCLSLGIAIEIVKGKEELFGRVSHLFNR